ncbi:MAG: type I 3-dehydroquinate dehydratase [Bacillota bacterium]|nr:type I 3-dehydroquinate dehydratase [Bacillota bacterium]
MKKTFVHLPQPFLVAVIREKDPASVNANIKNSEYDGADAYDLHLNVLEKQYRNPRDLGNIMSSTTRPVLLLNYRSDPQMTDAERAEEQLLGIRSGAAGIDLIGDYFDPDRPVMTPQALNEYSLTRGSKPLELTENREALKRQQELIGQIHELGGEVLLSSHTRVLMTTEQVIPFALEMESRGPDMIKIVTICLNENDLLEAFRTIVELKKVMKIPFQFQCHGQHSKLLRVMGPMLGSALIFCNQQYKPGLHPDQPLLRSMRTVLQNVDWRVSRSEPGESLNLT